MLVLLVVVKLNPYIIYDKNPGLAFVAATINDHMPDTCTRPQTHQAN